MKIELCDDPDCVGCKMEELVDHCKNKMNMCPRDVIDCFFDYMREAYAEEAIFQVDMEQRKYH